MGTFFSGVATVFYRLVDHSIEISVLICLIFLVKWFVAKKLPPWWHFSLWLILLIRMLVPIEFENRLNVLNFIPDISDHQVFEIMTDSSFESETSAAEFTLNPPPGRPDWRHIAQNSLPVLWLAGAVVFGIFILFKSISFWKSVRQLPRIADKEVLHLLGQCKNRMKIHADIDVIVTDKVRSPALFGYFHPRLLLPKGIFERLSDTDLSYAFMHELGHLKRHDIGVSWIMAFLQVVYWFNPLVWVAFYHIRIDQESACDESVLSRIKHHQSTDYAKAIVGFLEKFYQNCQLPSLAGVMENKTQMKRRIANIVHYKKYSRKLRATAVTLFISTGFILYLFTGVAKVKQAQAIVEPDLERSLLADAKSVADGDDTFGTETIPADFFSTRMEIESTPMHLTPGDISHSSEENGTIREVPGEDRVVPSSDESFSQAGSEAADETVNGVRSQTAEAPKQFSPVAASVIEPEKSNGIERKVEKNAELSVEPEYRAVKTGSPPDIIEAERKPEVKRDEKQPEGKKASSLVAAITAGGPAGASPGISPEKSGKESTGNRGAGTNYNVSALESIPEDSDRHAVLNAWEDGIEQDFGRGRADNRPETAASASAADGIKMASAGTEALPISEVFNPMAKMDRGNDSDDDDFFSALDVDMPPKLIRASSPQYPFKARRDKITGYIKLRFTVTKDGDAVDTTVVESSPKGVFDKSALEALESYRFKPGIKDGEAVDVQVSLPIKYDLS